MRKPTRQPALTWRQRALKGDEESLKQGLKSEVGDLVTKTQGLKVAQVDNLQEYEKPLVAHFEVTGAMGTVTSKGMILPMDVFVAEEPGRDKGQHCAEGRRTGYGYGRELTKSRPFQRASAQTLTVELMYGQGCCVLAFVCRMIQSGWKGARRASRWASVRSLRCCWAAEACCQRSARVGTLAATPPSLEKSGMALRWEMARKVWASSPSRLT